VVLAGLSMPCGMGVDDDGTVYVLEGGSTWPTRPHLPGRIPRLRPDGTLDTVGEEPLGGPRHIALRDGAAYVSSKGGHQ
jgi:sugar lactone lactonase YvrE